MKTLLVLIAGFTFLLPAESVGAQGRGAKERKAVASTGRAHPASLAIDVEIRLIHDYFAGPVAKPKPLPPGIARKLARGKPLPPGIAKKQLPDDLARRLPPRSGTRWIVAGDVILLIDVSDVIVDFVRVIL